MTLRVALRATFLGFKCMRRIATTSLRRGELYVKEIAWFQIIGARDTFILASVQPCGQGSTGAKCPHLV